MFGYIYIQEESRDFDYGRASRYEGGMDFELGTAIRYEGGRDFDIWQIFGREGWILNSAQHVSMREEEGFNESYFMMLPVIK